MIQPNKSKFNIIVKLPETEVNGIGCHPPGLLLDGVLGVLRSGEILAHTFNKGVRGLTIHRDSGFFSLSPTSKDLFKKYQYFNTN